MNNMNMGSPSWIKAKTVRGMKVGEQGNLYFAAVDWEKGTVDIDGIVYGEGVRTPTCRIRKVTENRWRVTSPDLNEIEWTEFNL